MEIPLESLYQCQMGLFQTGWGRIEISVSVKATAEEFHELWAARRTSLYVVMVRNLLTLMKLFHACLLWSK